MDAKKQTERNFFQIILMTAIPLICVGGVNFWANTARLPLIFTVFGLTVLLFVSSKIKLYISAVSLLWSAFVGMLCVSYIYSVDKSATLNYIIFFAVAISLLFMDFTEDATEMIIKIIQIIAFVYAVSILISVVIPNCMNDYFWFIVNPTGSGAVRKALTAELKLGVYSGFAREKAVAGLIMNSGIATVFAVYFSRSKLKKFDIITLICCVCALMLTGKRTLFAISIVLFAVFLLLSDIQGKAVKLFSFAVIALAAAVFILAFVPTMSIVIERFLDIESIETGSGRVTILWPYADSMFELSPIVGLGFGSYNLFAYRRGMRSFGEMWNYHAHNVYKQVLGELGIVGLSILVCAIITSVVLTIIYLNKSKNGTLAKKHLVFSLYIQLLFAIYSFTGNCIYQNNQVYFWFFAIAVALSTFRRIRSSNAEARKIGEVGVYA